MVTRKHVQHLIHTAAPISLTPRQQQVLDGIWQGLTNKDMAAVLQISVRTLEVHRTILMQIFQVHNVAQLIRAGLLQGVIQPLVKLPNGKRPR